MGNIILLILAIFQSAYACKNQEQVLSQIRFRAKVIKPEATISNLTQIAAIRRLVTSCPVPQIRFESLDKIATAFGSSSLVNMAAMDAILAVCGNHYECGARAVVKLSPIIYDSNQSVIDALVSTLKEIHRRANANSAYLGAMRNLMQSCIAQEEASEYFCRQAQRSIVE